MRTDRAARVALEAMGHAREEAAHAVTRSRVLRSQLLIWLNRFNAI